MPKFSKRFIDSVRFCAKAGSGGNGHPKFGGIGGKGGDVVINGKPDSNLLETQKILTKQAKTEIRNIRGQHSRNFRLIGEDGTNLHIPAPLGTVIKTDKGIVLGELNEEGEEVIVAKGGEGGCVSNNFIGQRGEKRNVNLLLKLIADIGLVGFPNAGKSTLLRSLSNARPKVAPYPFTTLHPTVGMLEYDDERKISMADLPGLIEGAWNNKGEGHDFLRHIERTKLLLFVIDIEGFKLGPLYPYRNPIETLIFLNRELELYEPGLVEKPCMLVVNKMDLADSKLKLREFLEQFKRIKEVALELPEEARPEQFVEFEDIVPCAANYPKSLLRLKEKLRLCLDHYEDLEYEKENVLEKSISHTTTLLDEKLPKLL